jgi:hypothetical protein
VLTLLQELMVISAEEAGEFTQSCMKIMRWDLSEQNRLSLIEEAGDLQCMIELLVEHGVISRQELNERVLVKKQKLEKYSNLIT